jgi:hypothetical protein
LHLPAPSFGTMSSLSFRVPAHILGGGGTQSSSESFQQITTIGQITAIGPSCSQIFCTQVGFIPLLTSEEITVTRDLPVGWNMISLPVVPSDRRISTLFPGASAVFTFTTEYEPLDPNEEIEKGKGYWVYLDDDFTYSVTGSPIDVIQFPDAQSGWSMIGPCSSLSAPSVKSGTMRAVFGFNGKYTLHGSGSEMSPLKPGEGYWINLSEQTELEIRPLGQ